MRALFLWAVFFLASAARAEGPPAIHSPATVRLPIPVELPLEGGAILQVLERHDLPLVAVEASFLRPFPNPSPAGRILEEAAASLANPDRCLTDGRPLQPQLEALGARMSVRNSWRHTTFVLLVPSPGLEPALDLLASTLLRPSFSTGQVGSLRREAVDRRRKLTQNPVRLLARAEQLAVFGPEHPLGRLDSLRDARGIRRPALRRTWAAMQGGGVRWYAVGDVLPGQMQALLDRRFSGLPASAPPQPLEVPPDLGESRVILVDYKDEQCRLGLSWPVPVDSPEDLAIAELLPRILESRLFLQVRERSGLTYSIEADLAFWGSYGRIAVRTQVAGDRTGDLVAAISGVLAGMGEVTAQEVEQARGLVLRDLIEGQERRVSVAALLDSEASLWGGRDRHQAMVDSLSQLDEARLEQAAARVLDPRHATWVLLGNRTEVEPLLEAAEMFPTHLWSPGRLASGR